MMEFSPDLTYQMVLLISVTAIAAGIVKGAVGFAMPMVFISILTLFFDQHLAIGILILPTFIANFWQVFRQGLGPAWRSVGRQKPYLILVCLCLLISSQLVPHMSPQAFFLMLGSLIVGFTSLMLLRWTPNAFLQPIVQFACAVIAGIGGGIAGVWGPPTIVYLSTMNLDKTDHMRAQGGVFVLGGLFLLVGHIRSGIVSEVTLPLSILAIIPACIGMWLGFKIHDRINQRVFRTATMIVLIVAGLNLIRRGFMG